jgi:hypothetical protein
VSRRAIRAALVGATALVVLLSGLVPLASPAHARELDEVDVTRATMRSVWLAPLWKAYGATAYRIEDYSESPEGRYRYVAEVGELYDSGRRCVLTRNRAVVVDGPCRDSVPWGGLELPGSGAYVLTVSGRRVASWTFTKPSDVPPSLAPATCEITSFAPGLVSDIGPTFQVATNGLCSRGYWYYQVDYPDGGQAYRRFRLQTDGVFLVRDLIDSTSPATISVAFLPRGYTELTAAALGSAGGTVPAWRTVPQALGY